MTVSPQLCHLHPTSSPASVAPAGRKGWIHFGLCSTHLSQCLVDSSPHPPPPHPPSLVTQPKNFNLCGLSVVLKYNSNGVGLFYPEVMKLLLEEIDTHKWGEQSAAGEDLTQDSTSNGNFPVWSGCVLHPYTFHFCCTVGARAQRACSPEGRLLLWLLSAGDSYLLAVGVLTAHGSLGEMFFWGERAPAAQLGKHLSHCPVAPGLQAGSSPRLTSSGHGGLSM